MQYTPLTNEISCVGLSVNKEGVDVCVFACMSGALVLYALVPLCVSMCVSERASVQIW